MNKKLILLYFFCITHAFSQKYESAFIIKKADSILKSKLNVNLYPIFEYDVKSYYEYTKKNKPNWNSLIKFKVTKGNFVNCDVRFKFKHPKYPWIYESAHIKLDSRLILIDSVKLDFIPNFLLEGRQYDYICIEEAIEIAKNSVFKERSKRIEAIIVYNPFHLKGYYWEVSNYLTEKNDRNGNKYGKLDNVFINPITGQIIYSYYDSEYGTLD